MKKMPQTKKIIESYIGISEMKIQKKLWINASMIVILQRRTLYCSKKDTVTFGYWFILKIMRSMWYTFKILYLLNHWLIYYKGATVNKHKLNRNNEANHHAWIFNFFLNQSSLKNDLKIIQIKNLFSNCLIYICCYEHI